MADTRGVINYYVREEGETLRINNEKRKAGAPGGDGTFIGSGDQLGVKGRRQLGCASCTPLR